MSMRVDLDALGFVGEEYGVRYEVTARVYRDSRGRGLLEIVNRRTGSRDGASAYEGQDVVSLHVDSLEVLEALLVRIGAEIERVRVAGASTKREARR